MKLKALISILVPLTIAAGLLLFRVSLTPAPDVGGAVETDQTETVAVEDKPPFDIEALTEDELSTMLTRGEQLYNTRGCIGCHVIKVDNVPFGLRPLRALDGKYDVESLIAFLRKPTPPMPRIRLGSEEDETALAVFLLSLE